MSSDGFVFRIASDRYRAEMRAQERRVDRATQFGLRDTSRLVVREARKRAPVYRGPGRVVNYGDGNRGQLEAGALKKSIKQSKRLRKIRPGEYAIVIGPRGGHVHLYADAQENRTPYMAPAYAIARSRAQSIHAKAWERAMR